MDLGSKIVWVVIAIGVLCVVVVALFKVGEVMVRRRTAAMIAAHGEPAGKDGSDEPPEAASDKDE